MSFPSVRPERDVVRSRAPRVPGIAEVLHARFVDPRLVSAVATLHARLQDGPSERFEVESRTAVLLESVTTLLGSRPVRPRTDAPLARRLRTLLDDHVVAGISLAQACAELGVSDAHLVRTFTREVGMPPHAYLTARP